MMKIQIIQANIKHLEAVTRLFDAYRVFYNQDSNKALVRAFISERLSKQDSVIFLALADDESVGFTQMYPSFSSVSAKRTWILNDLYVAEHARRTGVARRLMSAAKQHAKETHAKGISLATTVDNTAAKALYEALGYDKNDAFDYYFLAV